MPKLDYNIYGQDENSMANRIASESLDPGGKEDFWGATFDQGARAKGNAPEQENPEATGKNVGGRNDSRAKTAGNHGKQD